MISKSCLACGDTDKWYVQEVQGEVSVKQKLSKWATEMIQISIQLR